MKKERRIYVVGGDTSYTNWLEYEIVRRMEDATLVMFTGGEDVSASLYGKKAHPTTYSSMARDRYEIGEFEKARGLGLPMIGICRGAQALCVFAGGILTQDSRHPYLHLIKTNDGKTFVSNSTHHQQQRMDGLEGKAELLAWAIDKDGNEKLSPYSWGENGENLYGPREVEVAFYNEIKGLAIQGHPEMLWPPREGWEKEFINYCKELIVKYLE